MSSVKQQRLIRNSVIVVVSMVIATHLCVADEIGDLPGVFYKPAPRTLADLREIQDHVSSLVPALEECTVNLKIGPAQGSGVIVNAEGLILTAAHVSGPPGRRVIITDHEGRRHIGKTLGRNNVLDASMVQLNTKNVEWPFRPVADAPPSTGDWCLTLGHPGGLQTDRGMVLRLGRVILQNSWLVQTDCELIGGDSGGPLFDMKGQVIGINTRIGESTEYNFHVPVSAYTDDWDRLVAGEDFRSNSGAYLGITAQETEDRIGLNVTVVNDGEPGDRAGLRVGDLILEFEERETNALATLREMVGEEMPGKSVDLLVQRGEETLEIRVRLGMRWE